MCGLAAASRCGSAALVRAKVPRALMSCSRSYRFIVIFVVGERSMADALFTTASMPPKAAAASLTARSTSPSDRRSPTTGTARPPAASTCSAAV